MPTGGLLELSRDIYPLEAVQATVAAYEGLARFEVSATADVIRVTIADRDPDVADVLEDEFCNHALCEAVIVHRGTQR
ncbi:MAG: hypothetical protein ACI9WU_003342 [Myxococcota bacterium]|jgi:hypothetical protein